MAEETPPAPELVLPKAEAGVAFRAEMAITNFLLGYWKHMVASLVLGLLGVLVWGQWKSWAEREQRATSAAVYEIERKLVTRLPGLPDAIADGTAKAEDLVAPADGIAKIAAEARGTARVEAWLKAAELYRLAGKPDLQRSALEAGADSDAGVLTYAANAGLAALELEEGKSDSAIARFQTMRLDSDDSLAQAASLDLGLALESLGRSDEASRVYADFLVKWPSSKHAEQVRDRQTRVAGAPAPPAPAPAGAGG